MKKLRYVLALFAAKAAVLALRVTGHNGTNFPGVVALRICPDFLQYIAKPAKIIGVTGTNGKTTVSNLLKDCLRLFGREVLNNSAGSNTVTGIATSLIRSVTPLGRQRYETAVFELDERSSRLIFPHVQPDLLLVTNLSRDSIMRNGHPEFIGMILTRYLPRKTKLVLNADDLLSAFLAKENERVYYGIRRLPGDGTECRNLIDDMQICPQCRSRLSYEYNRYSNIGKAFCPQCDFRSPEYAYCVEEVDLAAMTMSFAEQGAQTQVRLLGQGVFNIYNEVSVIAVLRELGYEIERIGEALEKIEITRSRFDRLSIGGITFSAMLCKDRNAYAASRVFEYIAAQPGEKEILLYCNNFEDAHNWSENTCWLYDCDFELLRAANVRRIVTCGARGIDYKLRLLSAGIPEEAITYSEDAVEGVDALDPVDGEQIYLLYGTDSRTPAPAVRKRLISVLEQRAKEREVRA